MIALFTDFGRNGPYQGQMKNAIYRIAPDIKVIDLIADAPSFNLGAASHLLAALVSEFEQGTIFLSVIDPGVGGAREPCIVCADGYWFVGPNNGLFSVVASRAKEVRWWRILWQPETLSHTFHGRDLFAPVAARIAKDAKSINVLAEPSSGASLAFHDAEPSIIYIDSYGNVMTSILAKLVPQTVQIELNDKVMSYASSFSKCALDQAFWHVNSLGLVEIAVNCGSAAKGFDCTIGDRVGLIKPISS